MTDQLTGLPTHKDFPAAAGTMSDGGTEAILVDIAGLTWVNDDVGHQRGDEIIRIVGHLVARITGQEGGITYRFGGEEFLSLLRSSSHADSVRLADSIVTTCAGLKLEYRRRDHARDFVAVNAIATRLRPRHLEDVFALREYLAGRIYEASLAEGRDYSLVVDDVAAA